jgi:hypothetical protein
MSLPAAARHRWHLDDGGVVGHIDLGDMVIIVPGGIEALRAEMLAGMTEETWSAAAGGFGDPDLANA